MAATKLGPLAIPPNWFGSWTDPYPPSEIDLGWEEPTAEADPSYPHKCPACAGPAYVGLRLVSCKQKCKKEYGK